ncbi:hypothetical protein PHMEG_00027192 [Phytophthora megakarya]|uniref:RxLR effector protein n=1 Tax=Phytophthora megakarya TaxID=4795 RepID=A0A225V7G5_9STRA|nr:hypothetical protein PHMEG_00027192 [Phytophthora megakarya]
MHLSYTLLVLAASAVLASNMAIVSGRSTDISIMASPELDATSQTIGGEKRSLRYHGNDGLNEDIDGKGEDESDEDEERKGGANLFATSKLDEMVEGLAKGDEKSLSMVAKRFMNWKAYGKNTYNFPKAVMAPEYDNLRKVYNLWKYHGPGAFA